MCVYVYTHTSHTQAGKNASGMGERCVQKQPYIVKGWRRDDYMSHIRASTEYSVA